jgi:hypothetical protein
MTPRIGKVCAAPEAALAAHVADWLAADGWEVYPEVQLGYGCPRADLVALRREIKVAWAISCKTTLGFAVIEQAAYWRGYANWTSVAVPSGGTKICGVMTRCLIAEGVGVLRVDEWGGVNEQLPAAFRRPFDSNLLDACGPEHQRMGVAGSKHEYYTPFRATREAAERFVADHPHCTVNELLAGVKHHWRTAATARACVAKYIAKGVFGAIGVEPGSRPFRLVIKTPNG